MCAVYLSIKKHSLHKFRALLVAEIKAAQRAHAAGSNDYGETRHGAQAGHPHER